MFIKLNKVLNSALESVEATSYVDFKSKFINLILLLYDKKSVIGTEGQTLYDCLLSDIR